MNEINAKTRKTQRRGKDQKSFIKIFASLRLCDSALTHLFFLFVSSASLLRADWAEDKLKEMSFEEKIGQLFIVPACPARGEDHLVDLERVLKKYHVGGVILKQGDAHGQIKLIEWLQKQSSIPLLCVGDAEYGLGMRLRDTLSFPENLTLGAVQDLSLMYELGVEIGKECRQVGLHVNLAPVVDVNVNPNNPIIGRRSFGENPEKVAEHSVYLMKGMQESGVAACAKHFIGHGDTSVDSHVDLPLVPHPIERLEKVELLPFNKMIASGVSCVMSGHLFVPELDAVNPVPFSSKIIRDLLQTKMQFHGIVMSDALNMQALARQYSPEEIARRVFQAGHDFLLYGDHIAPHVDKILCEEIPRAFEALKSVSEEELNERVLKILRFKEKFVQPILPGGEFYSQSALALRRRLFRESITLIKNSQRLLPLTSFSPVKCIQIGGHKPFINAFPSSTNQDYSALIVGLFGLGKDNLKEVERLLSTSTVPTILILFTSPYALPVIPDADAVLVAYEADMEAVEAAVDIIFGRLQPRGRLPVTVSSKYPSGSGMSQFYE
jgi:beta-N-acetylhexosaminidase